MNIILYEQDEEFIKNILVDNIELTEIAEKGKIRQLKFKYYLQDGIRDEIEDFQIGNKIFINGSENLKTCLYVINGQLNNNSWTDGYIEGTCEEVITNLNYLPPLSQVDLLVSEKEKTLVDKVGSMLKGSFVITKERLDEFFGEQYNIGTVEKD